MYFAPIELTEAKLCFASTARYDTFFTYFFPILTSVNHLLEFQYSQYANYNLIMQKYQKQGLQVLPQKGTGTSLRFCQEMAEFTIFHALFFHNYLLFHPSSKTNMESLQTTPQTLLISQRIQGFIPKFSKLYKTIHL